MSQNREANEAFIEMNWNVMHNSIRSALPLPKSEVTFAPMQKMFPSLTPPAPAQCLSPPPLKNGPTPMDVDHMHGRGNPAVMCFCCVSAVVPEFLALADVSQVPPMENGDGEAEKMSDFVTCSK